MATISSSPVKRSGPPAPASRRLPRPRRYIAASESRIADPILRERITQVDMDQACLDLTLKRSQDGMKAGHKPGPETSIFKYYGTETDMRRRELMVSIAGPQGLGWEGPSFGEDELALTRD